MQELFPFAAGFLVGLLVQPIRAAWLRTTALVVLCLLFGFAASWLSGELEVSWGFLSVDALLVWAGALGAVVLAAVWRRRAV